MSLYSRLCSRCGGSFTETEFHVHRCRPSPQPESAAKAPLIFCDVCGKPWPCQPSSPAPAEKNFRRLLEESDLPIELAVEIADRIDQLERELAAAKHDIERAVANHAADLSATSEKNDEGLSVPQGESLWLIERTYAKGYPAERREFWLGVTTGDRHGDSFDGGNEAVWTTDALKAARFSSHAIAYHLRLSHFHPEAPVEACEHLFQCGISPEPAPVSARPEMPESLADLDWRDRRDAAHSVAKMQRCSVCGVVSEGMKLHNQSEHARRAGVDGRGQK